MEFLEVKKICDNNRNLGILECRKIRRLAINSPKLECNVYTWNFGKLENSQYVTKWLVK